MTESEKAQLGQLYNANHDPQLLNRRTWAKNLCMDYNQLRWDEGVKRTALLQELLGICGEDRAAVLRRLRKKYLHRPQLLRQP